MSEEKTETKADMAPTLDVLSSKRAAAKASITRVKTYVDSAENPLLEELECRLTLLEAYFKQLVAIQDQIASHEEASKADKDQINDFEDNYCSVKAKLLSKINELKRKTSIAESVGSPQHNQSTNQSIFLPTRKSNLPKVKLPAFSGNYIEYTNFINAFEAAVSYDQSLTNLEKFLHLKSCLSGEALQTIIALEVTDQNYTVALRMLQTRYGNKLLIFQSHICKLFDLPATNKGNSTQIRSVMDNVNVHIKALQSLEKPEQILNAMFIHLAKRKLDAATVTKWEETLDYESIPTWDQFYSFLDKRCQYLSSRDSSRKIETSISNKRSILTVSKLSCQKCNKSDHCLSKCPEFIKLFRIGFPKQSVWDYASIV